MGKQVYHTPKRKCSRCLYERRDTEQVSERIWPPAGGHLCLECLVPAAMEAIGIMAPLAFIASLRKLAGDEQDVADQDAAKLVAKKAEAARPSITCPECHMRSYSPEDIKQGYCGKCKWWTSHPTMRKVPKKDRE